MDAVSVSEADQLINNAGTLVRVPAGEVPCIGRSTQGVRVIRMGADERLIGLERVPASVLSDEPEEEDTDVDQEADG